ncbi:E3 ubiquitin-protein ligase rad18 [Podila humilis]|nr:E3 ubiquitin-protein ligase rad18 [Podila humilis]
MSTSVPASPQKSSLQSSFGVFSSSPVKFNGFPQHPQTKPGPSPSAPVAEPKRLPKLTYSVLTDKQLRKKLQELGIPSHGDKQLMQKRHAEYLTLYNANCDSTRPKPNSQLLKSLDSWEQTYLRDLNSKDFQRRAQEVQQQRYAQEMAHAQKQPAESITLSSDLANLPSSQSSNSGSSNGTNFVPNQANNNNINVAIAEQTAEAHKIKNADSYDNLIADIRKRMKAEKEAKAKAASEAATKAAVAEETIELTSQQSPSL